MIEIDMGTLEYYDEENNEFHYEKGGVIRFEYSLKAMYKWEAKWKKPFLLGEYSIEELKDFFHMMALDPIDKRFLTRDAMRQLSSYIGSTQTATEFSKGKTNQNGNSFNIGKIYTSEEIYGLMFMSQIPIEFENRNLNRLLVILRVITNYNKPKEKMSQEDIIAENRRLNEERKRKYGTKG